MLQGGMLDVDEALHIVQHFFLLQQVRLAQVCMHTCACHKYDAYVGSGAGVLDEAMCLL